MSCLISPNPPTWMILPVVPFLLATTVPSPSKHSISGDMATTRTVSRWEGRDVVNSPIIRQLKPRSTFLMADAIELTFILALVINCIATPSQSLQDFVSIVILVHSRNGTHRGKRYRVLDKNRTGSPSCLQSISATSSIDVMSFISCCHQAAPHSTN